MEREAASATSYRITRLRGNHDALRTYPIEPLTVQVRVWMDHLHLRSTRSFYTMSSSGDRERIEGRKGGREEETSRRKERGKESVGKKNPRQRQPERLTEFASDPTTALTTTTVSYETR